ncbi:Fe-S cluster assembly protein SufD [Sediminitomix flava]|uniref:Iron-regulated ABC transporter permease protein SufD n=1 Tax=Sediminitomix flava TaxID=379075 RepID=A0A315Z968_SEDFL|nr:Fe-S cluster assembly protein SufD [Sediminitomix flava]PWJ41842.1 iron-regulated ABC transporter permease protein SufD [Sediminitomix flava]
MSKVLENAALKSAALDQFHNWEAELDNEVESSLHQIRKQGAEALSKLDFPSVKDEEWKYTNIKKLVSLEYNWNRGSQLTKEDIKPFIFDGLEAHVFVFVNGKFNEELSDIQADEKAIISTLQDAHKSHADKVGEYFSKIAQHESQAFVAMNTAFAQDGVFVHVPRSYDLQKPVLLLYINDTAQGPVISQPRNLIVAEENAHLTLIEHTVTLGEENSLLNTVSEFSVAKHARIDHYKIQADNDKAAQVCTTHVDQKDESNFSNTVVTMSGQLIRNNLNINLDGEHCEAYMNGLYMVDGKTHVDNHTAVDHMKPNSYSNELYKGILDGKASGVFNGKIYVRPHAQKTNAFQSNKNVMLSEDASIDTKPQLEIWADDVKCSHGCTVGAMDEEPLFYLKARGINEDNAKALLMFAYCADVLDRVKSEPVKNYIEKLIADRLNYEFL